MDDRKAIKAMPLDKLAFGKALSKYKGVTSAEEDELHDEALQNELK